jgi:multidrug resistance efflux pump
MTAFKKQEQQLLSNEVNDIISYRPHWFIRKGNFIFSGILLFLLSLTFVIQYPDIVNASVRINAINAPVMLETKREGKLDMLLIDNGDEVSAGQTLAFIQSTGKHQQVIELKQWVADAEKQIFQNKLGLLIKNPLPDFTALGEVQATFQEFENIYKQTQEVFDGGYYQKKRKALQQDLAYLSRLKYNTAEQQLLIQQDQALQQKEFEAYEQLARDKVIAPLELNQYKSKLISKEQNLKQTESQITNSDISSHNKRKELLELDKSVTDQQQHFRSALYTLKSRVEEWLQQYVITAPVNGRLEFVTSLQQNQLLNGGQSLFYIQPAQTIYYSEMKAGQAGLGKIKPGQKVIMKLYGYPSAEFGHIEGRVSYISALPNERDSFLMKADLPKGLITNHNKAIFFRNHLSATAEIITDERKLIDRLLGQLKKIWER